MNKDKDFGIVPLIKILLLLWFLITIAACVMFTLNGQYNDAKFYFILETVFIILMYLLIRRMVKGDPYFFKSKLNLFSFSGYIITFIFMLLLYAYSSYQIRTYIIGDIKVTFPKEKYVYGFKDENKKYYEAEGLFHNCSIKVKKIKNNNNLSAFENIKNNGKLEQRITKEIKIEDIYNSDFTEGEITINGKSWVTNYTEVTNIKYTIYYLVIDDYIYQIDTANYNDDPKLCTDKIDETLKTIKYNK